TGTNTATAGSALTTTSNGFTVLDTDGNGSVSRAELSTNSTLAARFAQIDTNGDFTLSASEWSTFMSGSGTRGSSLSATTSTGARTSVDAGSRGRVGAGPSGRADAGGLGRVGATVSQGTASGTVALGVSDFARLDMNHDGLLTSNELSSTGTVASRLASFDLDGNGTLSRAEWQALTTSLDQ
ncbi:MAG TPA: hypothetical protein VFL14_11415, partial [Xanthomonadales bacterium]|nr:hypothetical protein [Xanthomonadales bacterium]